MTAKRPITTLFRLMSVDGKISTGATDACDMDQDFPKIAGVKEGLPQYYAIEQTTDLWSLISGKVQAKLGVNQAALPEKTGVSFVMIDNQHLTSHGVAYFCQLAKRFVLVTTNREHPAFSQVANQDNLAIIFQEKLDLAVVLTELAENFACEGLTIQTGGTLNGLLLREKLLDQVDLVVAPILIGGQNTSTLIDGPSLTSPAELAELGVLRLLKAEPLQDSYLRLRYEVIT